jgi:integrase
MSPAEAKRLLAMADNLKVKVMLTLCYGCGLRAGEACRLKVCDIDSELKIIRVVQAKGRKDFSQFKTLKGPPPAQKPLCHLRSPGLRFGLGSMFPRGFGS